MNHKFICEPKPPKAHDHDSLVYKFTEVVIDGNFENAASLVSMSDIREKLQASDFSIETILRTGNTNLLHDCNVETSSLESTDYLVNQFNNK